MTPERGQRILVVDDNDAGRYASGRVLKQAGFQIQEAATGAEALRLVSKDRPDLVLLDVRLPDIPGIEVCRRIKSSPETSNTLVLQMSASAVDDGARVTALDCGADGYIVSPVEPAALAATVRALLRIRTAELAVQEAALEWQATFDAIRDGVALLDERGIVQRCNSALPTLLRQERRQVVGRALDDLLPPNNGDPHLAGVLDGFHRSTAERALEDRFFRITVDPVSNSSDKLRGGVAIVTDITEHKLLDQQLQHSQKLESIGLLAGGVAHDFNNLLVGIMGNASLALETLEDPAATRQYLQDVLGASERAADLTRQLLAYAGKRSFIQGPVDLSALVDALVPLIQTSVSRKVRLDLHLRRGLPALQGDKTQLEQLVMNLIINASEAANGEVGSVTVTTGLRNVRSDEFGPYLSEHKTAGVYIVLEVRDTGCGMDPETLKRIFDPFFTTKFLGRGLGLSAALGIVRGHRGALKVNSVQGQGTVFEVLFPAGAGAALEDWQGEEAWLESGRGTILVADDEEIVRNLVEHVLTHAGYDVLLAENGAEALSVFARNAARISLVLLDLVMPVMSGDEVLPHLLTMKPGIPVIVSSGHSEQECRSQLREPRMAGFLQKPYKAVLLAEKVRAVLGQNSSTAR